MEPSALETTNGDATEQREVIVVGGGSYSAEQVVLATGPFQAPFVPAIADQLDPDVVQLHSTAYCSPKDLPEGRVLVVGGQHTRGSALIGWVKDDAEHLAEQIRASRPSLAVTATPQHVA